MGKRLYVGNLSYSVDNAGLEELFTPFGQVTSAEVVMDRETGRSKGFGFVELASDDEAQAAITALSGKEHGGRALTVNEARPREQRGGGFGGGGGGGGRGGWDPRAVSRRALLGVAADLALALAAPRLTSPLRLPLSASPLPLPRQGGWGNSDATTDGLAEFAEKLGSTVGEDGRRIVAAAMDKAARLKEGMSAFIEAVRR